jgi:hypothetical protein
VLQHTAWCFTLEQGESVSYRYLSLVVFICFAAAFCVVADDEAQPSGLRMNVTESSGPPKVDAGTAAIEWTTAGEIFRANIKHGDFDNVEPASRERLAASLDKVSIWVINLAPGSDGRFTDLANVRLEARNVQALPDGVVIDNEQPAGVSPFVQSGTLSCGFFIRLNLTQGHELKMPGGGTVGGISIMRRMVIEPTVAGVHARAGTTQPTSRPVRP